MENHRMEGTILELFYNIAQIPKYIPTSPFTYLITRCSSTETTNISAMEVDLKSKPIGIMFSMK